MHTIQLPPRYGAVIKAAELRQNMIYIETARGEVWRLWIDLDSNQPIVECIQWEEPPCR